MRSLSLLLLCVTSASMAQRVLYVPPIGAIAENYQISGANVAAYGQCFYQISYQNMTSFEQTVTTSLQQVNIGSAFQVGSTTFDSTFNSGQIIPIFPDGGTITKTVPVPGNTPGSGGNSGAAWQIFVPYSIPLPTAPRVSATGASALTLNLANIHSVVAFKISVLEDTGALTAMACVRCALINVITPQQFRECTPVLGGKPF